MQAEYPLLRLLGDQRKRLYANLHIILIARPRYQSERPVSGLTPVHMTLPGYDWTYPGPYDTSGL